MNMKLSSEKTQLVLDNQKLVHYFINKLGVTINSSDYDDLFSIGTLGLVKAAITFDSSKKFSFSTYASRCINNELFMSYRKSAKYKDDISLYKPFYTNNDGDSLFLVDKLKISNSNFVEKLELREKFIKCINIILNCLSGNKRLSILYNIGGLQQSEISEKLNISQSYISRNIAEARIKIQQIADESLQYKEVFSMAIVGDEYRISFSSNDVKKFNQIFAALLQNLSSTDHLPDFKVSCNKKRIVVHVPADPESFSFIAEIIQKIDEFNLIFITGRTSLSSDNATTLPETKADDIRKCNDGIVKVTNSEEITANTNNIINLSGKKSKHVSIIRDYITSITSFTSKDLQQHFSNLPATSINNAIYDAKKEVS